MLSKVPAASATRDRPVNLGRLVFFLPLGCYWLLAVVIAFHPRPLWVLAISALPLMLITLTVIGSNLGGGAEDDS
jgi:hypothetical protein